jgi:hypothetical protein
MSVVKIIQNDSTEVIAVPNPSLPVKVVAQPATAPAKVAAMGIVERIVSDVYSTTAGENLSGGRVVFIDNGKAFKFDPSNASLYGRTLGITVGAALTDDAVQVQFNGVMNWTDTPLAPGSLYYAGANGQLTTDPSGLTILQRVGHAIATNKLKINFDLNIITI